MCVGHVQELVRQYQHLYCVALRCGCDVSGYSVGMFDIATFGRDDKAREFALRFVMAQLREMVSRSRRVPGFSFLRHCDRVELY